MSKETKTKITQVIRQFFAKAALVISESRVVSTKVIKDPALNAPLVNKWFNLEMDESEEIRESLRLWKSIDFPSEAPPPPLVVETYLDLRDLGSKHNIYLTTCDSGGNDILGGSGGATGPAEKQFKVTQGGKRTEIVLERWIVQFIPSDDASADSVNWDDKDLQPTAIYKQAATLIRSLYTYAQILPVWALRKKLSRSKLTVPPLRIGCRVLDGSQRLTSKGRIGLTKKLTDSLEELESIYFPDLKTPFGSIKMSASHRVECDFSILDTEDFLSNQFFMQDNSRAKRLPSSPSSYTLHRRQSTSSSTNPASFPSPSRSSLEGSSSMASRNNVYRHHHARQSTDLSNEPFITSPTDFVARDRRLSSVSLRDSPMNSPLMTQQPHSHQGAPQSPSSSRPQVSLIQPFKTPSLSASPSDSSLSSRPQSFSRTTSNSSLAALRIPNRTMSNASTTSVGSYPRGQGPENAISSSVSSSKSSSAPKFSSSFGSRGAWNRSGSLSGAARPKRLSTELPGSLGSQGSFGPSSSLLVCEPEERDDDQGLNAFLHMITNIGQTQSASHNSVLLSGASSGSNSSFLLGSRNNINSNSPSESDILSRFQNMKSSHSALSDSLLESASHNSNKLSESPTMTSTTSPFPIPNASPPQVSKAVSQHTPSVPSRLSEEFTANDSFKAYYYSHPRKQNSLSSLKVDEEEIFSQEADIDEQKRRSSASKVNPLDIPIPSSKPFRRESASMRNSHTSGYTDMQVMTKTSHHQSLGAVGGGAIFPGKELSSFRLKPAASTTSIDNLTGQVQQLNLSPATTAAVTTGGSRRNSSTTRFTYFYDNENSDRASSHRRQSDGETAVGDNVPHDDDADDSQKYNSDDEDNDVFYFALNEGDIGGRNNGASD
jgi:autophagy-related protein 13